MPGGGWVTTHEDITEREKLQSRLEQQNQQLDAAMNNMSQGLAMFDDEQRLVVCNKLYAEMYGLTPEQVKPGTTVREILQHRLSQRLLRDRRAGSVRGRSSRQVRHHRNSEVHGARRRPHHQRIPAADGERLAGLHAPGHHGAAPLGSQDRAHGAARCADRPAQPRAAERAARACADPRQARRDAWRSTCSISTTSRP